jgi:phosphatidylserine/phosphatidylglycerophosphate/cardiolipin synthase-like enzyme
MADQTSPPWALKNCSYPPRSGNEVQILIDGQAAYREISAAFKNAKKFIYLTISYGTQDFLLVPEYKEALFDILRSRAQDKVDVRMVVWQPALHTPDTIPDPAPGPMIPGVNAGPGSIQARWDQAPGFKGRYTSLLDLFEPKDLEISEQFGCHHQKTYIMDDGEDGYVAFVGGINPVQAYWDTPDHDSLDARRVEWKWPYPLKGDKGLEKIPPLHDIFYRIKGPAVGDVLDNFCQRYNGATIPYADVTSYVVAPITPDQIIPLPGGLEVQVLRTIAPKTYDKLEDGDRGIRELYINALQAASAGSLVYIENQYFFDHGIISEIHAAAVRGAKIIALLTWRPDEGTFLGKAELEWERISYLRDQSDLVAGHPNVALLTLGNCRSDPRTPGKSFYSETYIHSKNMAVFTPDWTVMTGGSANIAFTSMWFHSEMNIAFIDATKIKDWVAQLWSEHLQIPFDEAKGLIDQPDEALKRFKDQAAHNTDFLNPDVLTQQESPQGRVYDWITTKFPARELTGIDLDKVIIGERCS